MLAVSNASRMAFATCELRRDRADKAVAGTGGIDRFDDAPGNDQRLLRPPAQRAPRLPSVTQMILFVPACNNRAASMKRS